MPWSVVFPKKSLNSVCHGELLGVLSRSVAISHKCHRCCQSRSLVTLAQSDHCIRREGHSHASEPRAGVSSGRIGESNARAPIDSLDAFKWWRHDMEHLPHYWTFVMGIWQWISPVKGHWCGTLMFIAWTICVTHRKFVHDLKRYGVHVTQL